MRYLAVLLIGVFLGGMGSMAVLRALQARHAQPRALMTLIEQQQRRLQAEAVSASCTGPGLAARLMNLGTLAGFIEESFARSTDALFERYRKTLIAAVRDAHARATGGSDCEPMREPLARIEDACDACHRDFR